MYGDKKCIQIDFSGHKFILNGLGSLYWLEQKVLIIADLHLEKGSYFAKKGNPLPIHDTFDTLKKIEALIQYYSPSKIITLGDNIHDGEAFVRMREADFALLKHLASMVDQWIWIIGNHDHQLAPNIGSNVKQLESITLENILVTHDDVETDFPIIMGHFHPVVKIDKIRGKCFVQSPNQIIMPAFGSYTGGLNVDSDAFKKQFPRLQKIFLLHHEKVWQIR